MSKIAKLLFVKKMLEKIGTNAEKDIKNAKNVDELRQIEIKYLGRKGELPLLLREIPSLPLKERPESGKLGNILRKKLENEIEIKKQSLENKAEDIFFDVTAPAEKITQGYHHPISKMITEIEDVFGRLGFESISGPEIEDDWHNFTALNIPDNHPAREMQDTFWIKNLDKYVLRTQTSNMQIRYMENNKPPIRIIAPGKTFRKDSDATHSPMFHQFEGLMVDKHLTIGNLKWVLQTALREILSSDIELRFRVSYFPFTEPSIEVDATCVQCAGKNSSCRVCKGTGWLEVGGAGMVHPNVLKNAGVDSNIWNGFAFGCGIERIIMLKHQIDDLRLFFENDLRFLEQF